MKILVTGAKGFIGKNLICELQNTGYQDIYAYDIDTAPSFLDMYTKDCDFVFHLAGVNRPKEQAEYMQGNFGFTSVLLEKLAANGNQAPVLMTSSIQASLDNPYGRSKKAGEELICRYAEEHGTQVFLYRLPNVFGKWCRPNYNSVVATFCYHLSRGLDIAVHDPAANMQLVYIDDVLAALIGTMGAGVRMELPEIYTVTVGKVAQLLRGFRDGRNTGAVADMGDAFTKKLYATYLSYLPEDGFCYPLIMHEDERGSFTEFIRTPDRGQVSVNISKPGVVKGNHWHHTKNEKFLVVSGHGVIRFRKVGEEKVKAYFVSGQKLEVLDIPPGYTHNIENLGQTDMVTVMWANEAFDPSAPDTTFLEV